MPNQGPKADVGFSEPNVRDWGGMRTSESGFVNACNIPKADTRLEHVERPKLGWKRTLANR